MGFTSIAFRTFPSPGCRSEQVGVAPIRDGLDSRREYSGLAMNTCAHCGQRKPAHELACPSCAGIDERVVVLMVHGTPLLTIAVLGLLGLSIYRFWLIGWDAWHGNLRFVALAAIAVGAAALLTGSMWPMGIRRRKHAVIVLVIAVPAFLVLNQI
jgi:hypothetical protein